MPLSPLADAEISELNTLGISARAKYLAVAKSPADVAEAVEFAATKKLPLFVLGGGSNIVIGADILNCLVLKMELPGREVLESNSKRTLVKVGAGENWDELVRWSVEQNLRGIESLSLIPGTVGAAPVQNVGAYGQEVSETITEVEVYDRQSHKLAVLSNQDSQFKYRDSIFKHGGKQRYIVTAVTFQLVPSELAPPPTYASLQAELDRRQISAPSVQDIREAVIAIRRSKLPDPASIPTAGSFFHNPIVSQEEFQEIQAHHPAIPHWPTADGHEKIAAAWLVEQCGLKGIMKDGVGLYERQAIALINPGHKPAATVLAFRDDVIATVRAKFGITLNMEPELIRF